MLDGGMDSMESVSYQTWPTADEKTWTYGSVLGLLETLCQIHVYNRSIGTGTIFPTECHIQ